jgi:tetratricopeptide (TPR) repeat protein
VNLLESVVKAHPKSPDPLANLVDFCLTHGNDKNGLLTRAEEAARQGLQMFPKSRRAYEAAVGLHLSRGQREEAAKVLEEAKSLTHDDGDFWLGLARLAQEVWPVADEHQRAAHLANINPFAAKALEAARKHRATAGEMLLQISDYYLFSNQLAPAAAICEDLVTRNNSLDARKRLVRLYDAMERPDDSFKALQDLVKAYPEDVEHRRLLASQYLQKQDITQAADQLEAALQAGGGDLTDYLNLGKMLRFTKDPERFEKFTRRAQQLFPQEPTITYQRALAMNDQGEHLEAAKTFAEAAQQATTTAGEMLDDQFYFHWGVALERSEQLDAAAKQFEKSINLTPSHDPPRAANTMNYLGYMWLEQGQNLDKAEELIRKANELEQNNAAFVDSLGWLLFKRGKLKEALAELLRAEHLMREFSDSAADAEILDHIAQTYDQLGQREEARAYWKRILDLNPEIEEIKARAEKALGAKPSPPAPAPMDEE